MCNERGLSACSGSAAQKVAATTQISRRDPVRVFRACLGFMGSGV